MAAIDTGIIKEVITALRADTSIANRLATDTNGNRCIRPGGFVPVGALFPQITLRWMDDGSEAKFPAENGNLHIIVWADAMQSEPYKFLDITKDLILALFNRYGSTFNRIDVPTNTGIRFNQFLKQSVDSEFDEVVKKYYCEIVFRVCKSDGDESFAPSDSGDQAWI